MNINDLRTIAAVLGESEPIDNEDAEIMRQIIIENFITALSDLPKFNADRFREEIALHEEK